MGNGCTPQQAVHWLLGTAPHLAIMFAQVNDGSLAIHLQPPHSNAGQAQAGALSLMPTRDVTPAGEDLLAEADESADGCCI